MNTPEGVISGSSVIEIYSYVTHGIDFPSSMFAVVRGEAVVVDLGKLGLLCWLLKEDPDRKVSNVPNDVVYAFRRWRPKSGLWLRVSQTR